MKQKPEYTTGGRGREENRRRLLLLKVFIGRWRDVREKNREIDRRKEKSGNMLKQKKRKKRVKMKNTHGI